MPKEPFQPKPPTQRAGFSPAAAGQNAGNTVPDLAYRPRPGASHDTVPEQAGVYVPPQPLAPIAEHRTMEIAPVRLSNEIDPRRAMTQLRISRPPPRRDRNVLLLPLLLAAAGLIAFVVHRISAASSAPPPPAVATAPAPKLPVPPPDVTAPPESTPAPEPPRALIEVPKAHAAPVPSAARVRPEPQDDGAPSGTARPPEKAREPWLE